MARRGTIPQRNVFWATINLDLSQPNNPNAVPPPLRATRLVPIGLGLTNIINITIIFIIFFTFFLFFPIYVLCVHYRFVRFSYYIGDQFIEPYGFSGSIPLFSYYHDNYCSLLYVAENKLVVVVADVTDLATAGADAPGGSHWGPWSGKNWG